VESSIWGLSGGRGCAGRGRESLCWHQISRKPPERRIVTRAATMNLSTWIAGVAVDSFAEEDRRRLRKILADDHGRLAILTWSRPGHSGRVDPLLAPSAGWPGAHRPSRHRGGAPARPVRDWRCGDPAAGAQTPWWRRPPANAWHHVTGW